MCLAIPARVISLHEEQGDGKGATVQLGGVQRKVSLALVDAQVGDYVIVHVGIAIARLDEQEAAKTLDLLAEMGAFQNSTQL